MKLFSIFCLLSAFFLIGCQEKESTSPVYGVKTEDSGSGFLRCIKSIDGTVLTKAVGVSNKLWNPGDTIRIKFLPNGSYTSNLEALVKQYANEWLQYANVHFEYVESYKDADVKIGFKLDSRKLAWSTIGTDCKSIPQNQPSLNFVLDGSESIALIKGEILRGFGHILGLGFEHKNPVSPIQFNDMATMYYQMFCGLSLNDIQEILPYYTTEQVKSTSYDPLSIMVLEIPSMILTDATYATTYNRELSEIDKSFIKELYPQKKHLLVTTLTTNKSVQFTVIHKDDIEINWGDGEKTINVFEHVYSDNEQEYEIKFYGSNSAIISFKADFNNLEKLNIANNISLDTLSCSFNNLTELNIQGDTSIRQLYIAYNQLSSIDLSTNINLKIFACSANPLNSLDVSLNPKLSELACQQMNLSTLDLSHNPNLTVINCSDNFLSDLNVSYNPKLNCIYCYGNPFITNKESLKNFANSLPTISSTSKAIIYINIPENYYAEVSSIIEDKSWKIEVL